MAATNRYMNFSAVGFTPSGGSSTPITGVQSINFSENGQALKEAGDFDLYNTMVGVNALDPEVTISTLDAMVLSGVASGTFGTLVFTIRDFKNGATTSGGARIFTITNAVFMGHNFNAQFRQAVTQSLVFGCASTDGATSPAAVAAA